ncbi:MAG: hypothetical protein ACR2KM_04125 [Gemmatimonadaceae bacterium]
MSPFKRQEPPKLSPEKEREIEAASIITPEDILRAQAAWRQDAPPEYKDLLDAKPDDGTSPTDSPKP